MEDQFGATPAQAAPRLIVQYKDVISMDPEVRFGRIELPNSGRPFGKDQLRTTKDSRRPK